VFRCTLINLLGTDMGRIGDTLVYLLHDLLVAFECTLVFRCAEVCLWCAPVCLIPLCATILKGSPVNTAGFKRRLDGLVRLAAVPALSS
jgi:hypothetical protein